MKNDLTLGIAYDIFTYNGQYGEGFIKKIFMNMAAFECIDPFKICCRMTDTGVGRTFYGVPIQIDSDGNDAPEYYFGI